MTRELEGLKEGSKAEIHIELLKKTQKNIKLENAKTLSAQTRKEKYYSLTNHRLFLNKQK